MMDQKTLYALTVLFFGFCASAMASPTLCGADEDIDFSCAAGKKTISVCASKDLAPGHGYIQYRFGSPAKVELTVPADKSSPTPESPLAGSMMFSGGGGAYLRFIAGDFNYVVYTAIGKGWGTKDGVAVERGGKRVGHVSCSEEPMSGLGDELFTKAGLKPDTGDFDLP
jgi:hypothetical protein